MPPRHEGGAALERWLSAAEADADRRGIPELKPLLRGLASSTAALRAAAWNDAADRESSDDNGASPATAPSDRSARG